MLRLLVGWYTAVPGTSVIYCSGHSYTDICALAFGNAFDTSRFTPLTRVCRICKSKVNQEHHYCQECAFQKGNRNSIQWYLIHYSLLWWSVLVHAPNPSETSMYACQLIFIRCSLLASPNHFAGICGMCGRKTDDITDQKRTAK